MRADLPRRHAKRSAGAGRGQPAARRPPAGVDRRIVRRCHHQQVAGRHHSELERRRRAAVRLHRGAGRGPPHLARHPRRAHRRRGPDHRQPEGRAADRPLRDRARAKRRPAHPGFAHDLADQGRGRQGRRRVQDRARRHAAAAGRGARAAAAGGSGGGERQVPRVLRAGRAVRRHHGRGRHHPRAEPAVLGRLRLHEGADRRQAVLGRPVVDPVGGAGGADQGGVRPGSGGSDVPRGDAVLRRRRQRADGRCHHPAHQGRGGPGLFLAPTGTDITDRKRAEADREKFVTLVENSTDFIGMCDLDGIPFFVNRAGLEMVGLDGIEQARRTPVRDFFFPEDQPRIMDEFFPVGAGEGPRRDRGPLPALQDRRGPLDGLQGVDADRCRRRGRSRFATVSQDVTERKRLEDDLRRLAADLSEADRRKDEFLATLAHELRNPLAPMRNMLEVLKRPADRETVPQARRDDGAAAGAAGAAGR